MFLRCTEMPSIRKYFRFTREENRKKKLIYILSFCDEDENMNQNISDNFCAFWSYHSAYSHAHPGHNVHECHNILQMRKVRCYLRFSQTKFLRIIRNMLRDYLEIISIYIELWIKNNYSGKYLPIKSLASSRDRLSNSSCTKWYSSATLPICSTCNRNWST